jgi:serine/threonine-protein kinase
MLPGAAGAPARSVGRAGLSGWLTLDTEPWASVYLDGRRLGVTPLARVPLPAGRHKLSIDAEDKGRRQPLIVRVAPQAETRLAVSLRRMELHP